MSLLIKALDKAEKAAEKNQEAQQNESAPRRSASNIANAEKADSVHPHNLTQEFYSMQGGASASAARAANVFDAKQLPANEISPMFWILGLGLLALLGIGLYFYYQLSRLQPQQPATLPVQMQAESKQASQISEQTPPSKVLAKVEGIDVEANLPNESSAEQIQDVQITENESQALDKQATQTVEKPVKKATIFKTKSTKRVASSAVVPKSQSFNTEMFDTAIASESASIKIVKNKRQSSIQPAILEAYDAYNQGRDQDAQKLYLSVLQKDIRNVDALLGMGAIAERQGRDKDALDWFKKVLEVEPRNTVALSAVYDQQLDADNKEQKLKSLISKEPNAANAHADLANYYAQQQQWGLAQQSYFEAYRLNTNAESAFNLAISLDQMGKSNLALHYYQEALTLSQHSSNNSIDEAAVNARIAALQSQ